MNQKYKNVIIYNDLLSYRTAVRGEWLFKASVYKEKQVMIIGFNRDTAEFFTKFFNSYSEVLEFLDYLNSRSTKKRKVDFPEEN